MKTPLIAVLALLVAGCASMGPQTSLTPEQAGSISAQLANAKADSLYHCRPFQEHEAHFAQGRWIWLASSGHGLGDLEARVELAADGSTNRVTVQLFDNLIIMRF